MAAAERYEVRPLGRTHWQIHDTHRGNDSVIGMIYDHTMAQRITDLINAENNSFPPSRR